MHLASYWINRLATLIHCVHCSRNRDVYVMLACVIHTGVGHHRFLKVILKNVLYSE